MTAVLFRRFGMMISGSETHVIADCRPKTRIPTTDWEVESPRVTSDRGTGGSKKESLGAMFRVKRDHGRAAHVAGRHPSPHLVPSRGVLRFRFLFPRKESLPPRTSCFVSKFRRAKRVMPTCYVSNHQGNRNGQQDPKDRSDYAPRTRAALARQSSAQVL